MAATYRSLPASLWAYHADRRRAVAIALLVALIAGPATATAVLLVLVALEAAAERRQLTMLALYGAALTTSVDSLTIAPLMMAMFFSRRFAKGGWRIGALAIACLLLALCRLAAPTVALPVADIAGGGPTLWTIAALLPLHVPLLGLAIACVVGTAALLAAHFSASPLNDRAIMPAATLVSLAIATLLPAASLQCFALPLALAIANAFARARHGGRVAGLAMAGLSLAVLGLPAVGAVAVITATLLLAATVLRPAANDNQFSMIWPILARNG